MFRQAERSVLVVGYAVYQGRDVYRTLAERMDHRPYLLVRMFLEVQRGRGDTSRASEILRRFAIRFQSQEWPGHRLPEVYYDPRSLELDAIRRSSLHAKCVVIDERIAFISSANFTEAAQLRNIEVGALIQSTFCAPAGGPVREPGRATRLGVSAGHLTDKSRGSPAPHRRTPRIWI